MELYNAKIHYATGAGLNFQPIEKEKSSGRDAKWITSKMLEQSSAGSVSNQSIFQRRETAIEAGESRSPWCS